MIVCKTHNMDLGLDDIRRTTKAMLIKEYINLKSKLSYILRPLVLCLF